MHRLLIISLLLCGAAVAQYKPLLTPNDHAYCEASINCTTNAVDTTGAKLAVVLCAIDNPIGTCAVTSSFSASWVLKTQVNNATDGNSTSFYALSPSTSASSTVTCSVTVSSSTDCVVYYFSLASGLPAFDTSATASTGGVAASSLATSTMTLSSVNDLVVTFWTEAGSHVNTMLVNSPFTLAFEPTNNSGHDFIAVGYTAATDNSPHNMTSNILPSPFVASASTQQNPAWWAFDGLYGSDSWLGSNNGTDYLCIDLGSAKVVNVYGIVNTQDTPARSPKAWTFNGSNSSCTASLVTLDTESGVTVWNGGANYVLSWPIANTTAYRYYVVSTTLNQDGNPFTGWAEEYLYTLNTLGSTSITPTWSICSGTGCASTTNMIVQALAFKASPQGTSSRVYVIQH